MKKKLAALSLIVTLLLSSFGSSFASSRLDQPVIEEIEAGKNSIKIDWNYVENADGYDIYRSTSSNGKYKYLDTADESWYRDYDIKKGKKYYYKVRAVSNGEYENSKFSKWRSGKVEKPASKSSSPSSASASASSGQTVYIANSGTKYHNAGCRYLHNGSQAISLSTAQSYGYTPCKVCH